MLTSKQVVHLSRERAQAEPEKLEHTYRSWEGLSKIRDGILELYEQRKDARAAATK